MTGTEIAGRHFLLVAEYISSGGTRTYVKQLLDFYGRNGARVTLVPFWDNMDDEEISEIVRKWGFSSAPYSKIMSAVGVSGKPAPWSYARMRAERRAFRDFASYHGIYRVVVSTGTPGLLAGACGAAPRALYILHTYPHGMRQRILGACYQSRFFPADTQFVTVSNYECRSLLDHWGPRISPEQVVTIHSTVGPVISLREKSQLEPLTVLTAAGVVTYKQPMMWVEVAKAVIERLPDKAIEFVWLGEGPLLNEARKTAEEAVYGERIHFVGLVNDVKPYYERSHIYLQLSSIETLGLSVVDAQRFGLPAVVTDVGGLPEIVTPDKNGTLIGHGDLNAAVQALVRLLTSTEERQRMALAAQRNYQERFGPERWERAMLRAHS